jgi:hypothetical protein
MRLSSRAVTTYSTPNAFGFGNQWIIRAGDSNTLYFQIIDLDQGPSNSIGGIPYSNQPLASSSGLRYLVGLSLQTQDPRGVTVTFPSINSANTLALQATQVSPADASLWSVQIPSSAQPAGGNVIFQVNENGNIRTFAVQNLLAVEFPNNNGSC